MNNMVRGVVALAATAALMSVTASGASAAGLAGTPTATDTDPTSIYTPASHPALPGGGQALWDGGALVFPADPDSSAGEGFQVYRSVAAALEAPRPVCADGSLADDGTATVTASVRLSNDGPSATAGYGGGLRLFDGAGNRVSFHSLPESVPAGHVQTLTASATIPATALAAGEFYVLVEAETYHSTDGSNGNIGTNWTADQFEATYEFGAGPDCELGVPVADPWVAAGTLGVAVLGAGVWVFHRRRDEASQLA